MESTAVERAERPEATAAEQEEAAEREESSSEATESAESAESAEATDASKGTPSGPGTTFTSNDASDYDRNRALGIRVIAFVIALCVLVAGWAVVRTAGSNASHSAGGKGHRSTSSPAPPRLTQLLPSTFTIPGSAPAIPWPSVGQATVELEGYGSLGTSGNVNTPVPIASVTKTMTAYLILAHHPLAAGESGPLITVSSAEAAAYATESKQGQSLVKVYAGEQISERDALEALMLASADNVAKMLARWDAGSVSAFVAQMNAAARKLGMSHTTYTDPSGLDPSTVSTATDQVKLGQAAMQSAAFATIVGRQSASVPVQGTIHNFNRLVGHNGVTGIKTGSTDQAGGCLLFADTVTVGDRSETIIGAVLGQPLGTGDSFLDRTLGVASKLIAAAQGTIAATTIALPGSQIASLLRTGTATETPLGVTAPVIVVGRPGQAYRVSVSGGAAAPVLEVTVLNPAGSGSASGPAVTGSFSVPLVRLLPRGALSAR
jgi:D-alanyl-D-alanine carboxypeptidase (penicillin-binding protein 5/6)